MENSIKIIFKNNLLQPMKIYYLLFLILFWCNHYKRKFSNHTWFQGWVGGGWGCVLSLYPPPEKIFSLYPPSKKILLLKMEKFGQKMSFFGNFLTNPQDFHKSAVKFHDILWPPPPPQGFLAGIMSGSVLYIENHLIIIIFVLWFSFMNKINAQYTPK